MNTITKFRLCTLTDKALVERVDRACDEMYRTGRVPDRQIPARPDHDFDLLLGELIIRFRESKMSKTDPISAPDRAAETDSEKTCEACALFDARDYARGIN